MKKNTDLRTKKLTLCLNGKELDSLKQRFTKSTCRNISEYIRKTVLAKPVTFNQRNASLDELMAELTCLRTELVRISAYFEQKSEQIGLPGQEGPGSYHAAQREIDRRKLLSHIEEIKNHITQTAKLWLPS